MQKLKSAFWHQRKSAVEHKIEFNLTFDEWLEIWLESGKLPQRGRHKGQYRMFRKGGKGAFSKGNIEIGTGHKPLPDDRNRYSEHKDNARRRGIPFTLTFDEWLKMWVESGHYYERGFKNGQYVMSRFEDKGPYTIGNISIILAEENRRAIKHSEEEKQRRRKVMIGNKYALGIISSPEKRAKISASQKGRIIKEETKEKIRKTLLGHEVSAETRAKISITKKTRFEAKRKSTDGQADPQI